jgi:hypothetical protein
MANILSHLHKSPAGLKNINPLSGFLNFRRLAYIPTIDNIRQFIALWVDITLPIYAHRSEGNNYHYYTSDDDSFVREDPLSFAPVSIPPTTCSNISRLEVLVPPVVGQQASTEACVRGAF